MIRVLIVDDSPTARLALRHGLERDSELLVVGEAATGAEAIGELLRLDPDLVTLDVLLNDESGLKVAGRIMAQHPVPILMVSSTHATDPSLPFRALQVGAVEAIAKLPSRDHPNFPQRAAQLARAAKAVARTPILHRDRARSRARASRAARSSETDTAPGRQMAHPAGIVIGGSTGAPPVVARVLAAIPVPSPVPVLVAQHLSEGFAENFAPWLAEVTGHDTEVVKRSTTLTPGRVYVAPDDRHVELKTPRSLALAAARAGDCCPSIDRLFSSAAERWGAGTIAVLLTGMGRDGSVGLSRLGDANARILVQEPTTCAVDSMPTSALATGITARVLAPDEIANWMSSRRWETS